MQALSTELTRVTSEIEKLSFYKDRLTHLISSADTATVKVTVSNKRGPYKKRRKATITNDELVVLAGKVADIVRASGCTKMKAARLVVDAEKLSKEHAKVLGSRMAPAYIGKELHDKLFADTKYVQ
jgi:hypothetical protein